MRACEVVRPHRGHQDIQTDLFDGTKVYETRGHAQAPYPLSFEV